MKLSEAIRVGAIYPDVRGPIFDGEACCALGGAFRAGGLHGEDSITIFDRAAKLWPILRKRGTHCPLHSFICGANKDILDVIICLFETHMWSKKAIAEWVETIENKVEAGDKQEGVTVGKTTPPACAYEDKAVYPVHSTIA